MLKLLKLQGTVEKDKTKQNQAKKQTNKQIKRTQTIPGLLKLGMLDSAYLMYRKTHLSNFKINFFSFIHCTLSWCFKGAYNKSKEKKWGHRVRAGQNYQNFPKLCGLSVKIVPVLKKNRLSLRKIFKHFFQKLSIKSFLLKK